MTDGNRISNFVVFRPRKQLVGLEAYVTEPDVWRLRVQEAGLPLLPGTAAKSLRFHLTRKDLDQQRALLQEIFATARVDYYA
jgi:hypothetical protein